MFSFPLQILCQMLKYPEGSMSCCMPRLFEWRWCWCVGVLLALFLSLSLTCFFPHFNFIVFFCACCGSRTLCNAYESTPSGEVPLRRRVCRTHFRTEKQYLWKTLVTEDTSWKEKCAVRQVNCFAIRNLSNSFLDEFWWVFGEFVMWSYTPICKTLNVNYVKCQS